MKKDIKILAIVQARMTSTRLPGKVMRHIMGRPIIGYLLERLSFSAEIDKIMLAIPIAAINDELAHYITGIGFEVYRGDENDVLDRYYQAALKYKPDGVLRITADCPLIDPRVCDRLISRYKKEKADKIHTGQTFAEGLDAEIFSYRALEIMHKKAVLQSEREHVSLYIRNHPDDFKVITIENETDDSRYRFTIDEPEDFEVVETIFSALYKRKRPLFTTDEIKRFLDNNPQVFRKSAHIIRNEGLIKSLRNDKIIK